MKAALLFTGGFVSGFLYAFISAMVASLLSVRDDRDMFGFRVLQHMMQTREVITRKDLQRARARRSAS